MQPTILELTQARLESQGAGAADSWADRILWIVDTYESGSESGRFEALGDKVGKSAEAIRLVARGKSIPGGDTLAAMVRAYPRLNPKYLLTGAGPREWEPDAEASQAVARDIMIDLRGVLGDLERRFGPMAPPADAAAEREWQQMVDDQARRGAGGERREREKEPKTKKARRAK